MKTKISVFVILIVLVAVIAGCGSRSPYVGKWVSNFSLGGSDVTLNGDGTGSANGFCFTGGATFTWREDGDHIVIENWQGGSAGGYEYGKISPDGSWLSITGQTRGYLDLQKEK